MKRRIFVAIELPADLKAKLAEFIRQWRWLPLRWIPEENWHVTVIPPVYLEDAELDVLIAALRSARLGGAFTLQFEKITLAPSNKPSRMIWLVGPTPPELGKLAERVTEVWNAADAPPPDVNVSKLTAHVTLARFESGELAELEAKTNLLEDVRLTCPVGEIAVMESTLLADGARYETRATIPV